jgi:hypothetical protein
LWGLDRGCKAGEGLIVHLHYTGEKPLRGYVLTFDSADSGVRKLLNDEILEEARGARAIDSERARVDANNLQCTEENIGRSYDVKRKD